MKHLIIPLFATAVYGMSMPSSPGAESKILWQIGKADASNAEFALAPGGYAKFKQDGFFVVGQSDPKITRFGPTQSAT